MVPQILLSTASLYFVSLPQMFRLARQAGFDGLELSPTLRSTSPERIQALARETGFPVASLHPPTVPLPGWVRPGNVMRRLAGLARRLPGCRIVVLHFPAVRSEADPRLARFYRRLEVLQEGLAGSGIAVALENRNRRPGEPLGLLDCPAAWIETGRRLGCGLVLDTSHASTLPFALLEIYREVRPLLLNIHLSDVRGGGWWVRFSYPRSIFGQHALPGTGSLPLPALLREMGQDGYTGLITLELSPVALRFWNRPALRAALQRSLQDCRLWVGKTPETGPPV
ncbi:MAG: sugar phosphate isomerase/epimerase family protein [Chloroflexia bacterium]